MKHIFPLRAMLLLSILFIGCSSPSGNTPAPTPTPTPTPKPKPTPEPTPDPTPAPEPNKQAKLAKWIKCTYTDMSSATEVTTYTYDDQNRIIEIGAEDTSGASLGTLKLQYSGQKINPVENSFRPGQVTKVAATIEHQFAFFNNSHKNSQYDGSFAVKEILYTQGSAQVDAKGKVTAFRTKVKRGSQKASQKNEWNYQLFTTEDKVYRLTWEGDNLTRIEVSTISQNASGANKLTIKEEVTITYSNIVNSGNLSILGTIAPLIEEETLTYQNILPSKAMKSAHLPQSITYHKSNPGGIMPEVKVNFSLKYETDTSLNIPLSFEVSRGNQTVAKYEIHY